MGRVSSISSFVMVGTLVVATTACSRTPPASTVAENGVSARHERADRQARVPNEYLVTLVSGGSESVISERYARYGIKEVHALGGDTYLMILNSDPGPGEIIELVQGDARFAAIQPNLVYWANRTGKKAN